VFRGTGSVFVHHNGGDVARAHAPESTSRDFEPRPRGYGDLDQQDAFGFALCVENKTFVGEERCADDGEPRRRSREQTAGTTRTSPFNDCSDGVAKSLRLQPGSGASPGVDDPR
jgi:hypothetical protein